jgi:predicted nucleotide-binding protein (sugar kinase/HSP70/actin superfamily)
MYEAEYRLAVRNAGFEGFRVILFDQGAGVDQVTEGSALEMNLNFFLVILNALFIGDLVNEVGYHIRPYEVVPGSTDAALAECLKLCQDALEFRDFKNVRGNWFTRKIGKVVPMLSSPDDLGKIIDQLTGDTFPKVMRQCKDLLNEKVEVDYSKPKPTVKVTGEFWAQTTEGDGNFHMFRFLEGEGAQVLVEPVATWIGYMLHLAIIHFKERGGLDKGQAPPKKFWAKMKHKWNYNLKLGMFKMGDRILDRCYTRLRAGLGNTAHKLVNHHMLQKLAEPFYHSQAEGGEGYMEVGKAIYYASNNLAHMVLSLKPFGCMPSTQSDGAQAAVTSAYPDMIFLPIETSGEGDINAYSRTQMALGEAKVKCKNEYAEVVARCGYPLAQVQQHIADNRELRRPIQVIPLQKGVIGQGANFVLHVADMMRAAGVQPKAM